MVSLSLPSVTTFWESYEGLRVDVTRGRYGVKACAFNTIRYIVILLRRIRALVNPRPPAETFGPRPAPFRLGL